mgnify:CR=1 FL=1|jgi:hypothetical protein
MFRRITSVVVVGSALVVLAVAAPTPAEAKKSDDCQMSCTVDSTKEIGKCSDDFTNCVVSCPPCKGRKCDDACRTKCTKGLETCMAPTKRKVKECIDACQEK